MTPKDLYRACRVSAWRLETLQHYDEERQRAVQAGEPLPPPRPGKLDDMRLTSELRQAGIDIGRVHVVDRPLTAYLLYELAVYPENVGAGEDVRIADRSVHPELSDLDHDFAIFDAQTSQPEVILFSYDEAGRILGYEHTRDAATVQRCREQIDLALSMSVPLGEFAAIIDA